jgi:hypothetical protein
MIIRILFLYLFLACNFTVIRQEIENIGALLPEVAGREDVGIAAFHRL